MIEKPPAEWARESEFVSSARDVAETTVAVARTGAAAVRTGLHLARGVFCSAFAVFWAFVALTAGSSGSFPTFFGVGLMAAAMAWAAARAFAKARGGAGKVRRALSVEPTAPPRATADRAPAAAHAKNRGGWGAQAEFDADAIIARHLAARAQPSAGEARGPESMVQADKPRFGRKVA